MIDPKQAKENGIPVKGADADARALRQEKLQRIKAIAPQAVNSDGTLDVDALRAWLGEEPMVDANNRGYALNFAGKGLARALADAPITKEFKVEQKQSKNFAESENIVIRGDNLDALQLLKQGYEGKVKMIYIDPPYNTTNEEFIYGDNFRESDESLIREFGVSETTIDFISNIYGTRSHSGWLAFMYPRLQLARDLLTDDGVIFISIDDHEQANLKIICDEIFGDGNECLIWRKIDEGRYGKMKNTNTVRNDHEYVLAAFKDKDACFFNKVKVLPSFSTTPRKDSKGKWWSGYIARGQKGSNPNHSRFYTVTAPNGKQFSAQFEVEKSEFEELNAQGYIHWSDSGTPYRKVYTHEKKEVVASSVFLDVGTSYSGACELEDVMQQEKIFSNPKPVGLVQRLIELATANLDGCYVLDFFAGSGTTAQAVMQLNAEDGGKRKFILVQLDEKIDKKQSQTAHKFCVDNRFNPVISSITLERLNRAGEKIKEDMKGKNGDLLKSQKELDIGYKVFSLRQRPELEQGSDQQFRINFLQRNAQDTLYSMLAASGKELHHPIETVEEGLVYRADEAYYVLGECKTDFGKLVNNPIYVDGYAEIGIEFWLKIDGLKRENLTILY